MNHEVVVQSGNSAVKKALADGRRLLAKGRSEEAIARLSEAIRLDPDRIEAYLLRAEAKPRRRTLYGHSQTTRNP